MGSILFFFRLIVIRIDAILFLQVSYVLHWLRGLLSGLEFLFKHNVVHRNLKLENLLLAEDGGIKIANFGMAIVLDSEMKMQLMPGEMIVVYVHVYKTGCMVPGNAIS